MRQELGIGLTLTLFIAAGCGNDKGQATSTTTAWLTPSSVPAALAAPAGATVKVHDHAVGAQIYTCTASTADGSADAVATTYAWVLKAPDANLYDSSGAQVGTHGAGPHWASNDGSVIYGMKVAQADAPAANAIPWLLLRVTSETGTGLFSDITYVQRLDTAGGTAPATGCDWTASGMDVRSDYSAEYYFYTGGV
jgi:hypothetical protein